MDIALQAIGVLLCGLALLLPLYYSQWFSDGSDKFSSARVLSPPVQEHSLTPTPAHFEILHSAHQHGLIRYNGYVYLLRRGDVLPARLAIARVTALFALSNVISLTSSRIAATI